MSKASSKWTERPSESSCRSAPAAKPEAFTQHLIPVPRNTRIRTHPIKRAAINLMGGCRNSNFTREFKTTASNCIVSYLQSLLSGLKLKLTERLQEIHTRSSGSSPHYFTLNLAELSPRQTCTNVHSYVKKQQQQKKQVIHTQDFNTVAAPKPTRGFLGSGVHVSSSLSPIQSDPILFSIVQADSPSNQGPTSFGESFSAWWDTRPGLNQALEDWIRLDRTGFNFQLNSNFISLYSAFNHQNCL